MNLKRLLQGVGSAKKPTKQPPSQTLGGAQSATTSIRQRAVGGVAFPSGGSRAADPSCQDRPLFDPEPTMPDGQRAENRLANSHSKTSEYASFSAVLGPQDHYSSLAHQVGTVQGHVPTPTAAKPLTSADALRYSPHRNNPYRAQAQTTLSDPVELPIVYLAALADVRDARLYPSLSLDQTSKIFWQSAQGRSNSDLHVLHLKLAQELHEATKVAQQLENIGCTSSNWTQHEASRTALATGLLDQLKQQGHVAFACGWFEHTVFCEIMMAEDSTYTLHLYNSGYGNHFQYRGQNEANEREIRVSVTGLNLGEGQGELNPSILLKFLPVWYEKADRPMERHPDGSVDLAAQGKRSLNKLYGAIADLGQGIDRDLPQPILPPQKAENCSQRAIDYYLYTKLGALGFASFDLYRLNLALNRVSDLAMQPGFGVLKDLEGKVGIARNQASDCYRIRKKLEIHRLRFGGALADSCWVEESESLRNLEIRLRGRSANKKKPLFALKRSNPLSSNFEVLTCKDNQISRIKVTYIPPGPPPPGTLIDDQFGRFEITISNSPPQTLGFTGLKGLAEYFVGHGYSGLND